jgi:5-methyltetrahydrofolate--homocysteine methyltransferase
MEIIESVRQAVIRGDRGETPLLVQQAMDSKQAPLSVMQVMMDALDTVGMEWRAGNMFIPEVMLSANAMHLGMEVLRPHLSASEQELKGTILIGTVQGDLHDIGKSLVAMIMEGSGFKVVDLGVDVSPARFVSASLEHRPEIIAMSALLTTTLPFMRDTIRSLEEAGIRDELKVMVGGAPVTEEFSASIGADGTAPDAATAVDLARMLLSESG